jgi:hypothetical protein
MHDDDDAVLGARKSVESAGVIELMPATGQTRLNIFRTFATRPPEAARGGPRRDLASSVRTRTDGSQALLRSAITLGLRPNGQRKLSRDHWPPDPAARTR